ncbi:patatin-like phospholipase family protein [Jannaschia sp. 2305UL9-9]|uniref:patatin-like phospholipase family protein n=1 Tax=Jannaschia sp. 2305UL9-9 TaxID=3121638 RepID=UPI00352742FA
MTRDPDNHAPSPDRPVAPYAQLVFSGGGLRCFWHGGFMAAASDAFRFKPERVTGSSGGALSAAAWIAGVEQALYDRFSQELAHQDDNLALDDMDGEHGRSPHQRIYDAILRDVLTDAVCADIADGPAFQISVSTPGASAVPTARALAGGTIYQLEQLVSPTPRPRLSAVTGMEQRLIDARQAARDGSLRDLVRMAATVPPAFRPDTWDGEAIYDGGMVDKAPLPVPDKGATLILLTKRFHRLPDDDDGRCTYVQPEKDILPGAKLDFTDPDLLKTAWDQGRSDGQLWRNKISRN